jgi:hypothetical protein
MSFSLDSLALDSVHLPDFQAPSLADISLPAFHLSDLHIADHVPSLSDVSDAVAAAGSAIVAMSTGASDLAHRSVRASRRRPARAAAVAGSVLVCVAAVALIRRRRRNAARTAEEWPQPFRSVDPNIARRGFGSDGRSDGVGVDSASGVDSRDDERAVGI